VTQWHDPTAPSGNWGRQTRQLSALGLRSQPVAPGHPVEQTYQHLVLGEQVVPELRAVSADGRPAPRALAYASGVAGRLPEATPLTPGARAVHREYSGTSLAQKLGVKPDQRVLLWAAPRGWTVPELPAGAKIVKGGDRADIVVAFFREAVKMAPEAGTLGRLIAPDGLLWLAWPRRAGGHTSDITDNLVREIVLPTGMVDTKVAALDQDWSALKFVWRKELRAAMRSGA
jgi:hypothetical protein